MWQPAPTTRPTRSWGAHLDDHGHVTVRSVKHLAKSVTVVTEAGRTPMEHEAHGVWVAVLEPLQPGHVPDYRLEVEYDADSVTVDDPYHYLPTVGEVDLHLIGEGRHERLWDVLGRAYPELPHVLGRCAWRVLRRVGSQCAGCAGHR